MSVLFQVRSSNTLTDVKPKDRSMGGAESQPAGPKVPADSAALTAVLEKPKPP